MTGVIPETPSIITRVIPETPSVSDLVTSSTIPEEEETPVIAEETGVVAMTIHLHHPISVTANKPHMYVDEVTFQKYPQLSPHASEDFIKVQ